MKKILALLLALVLVVGLVACGAKTEEEPGTTDAAEATTEATEEAAEEATEEAEAPAFTTVVEGQLTMGTNAAFPPYEFVEGGEIVGIDAEIAGAIAEKLGLELVIDDMEFDSIIEAVRGGKADIGMAGMTVTDERMESVDFTPSYATGVQVVIVKEDSEITTVDDLFADGAYYAVGVQRNTTGDIYATGDIEDAGLGEISRFSKGVDAVQALVSGKVDCVVIDNEPAKAFVESVEGLKILDSAYAEEDYAGAMNKENTALSAAINAALEELIADGTVQSIIDKYISAE